MWDVVEQVQSNGRHELTLTGAEIDKRAEEIADDTSGLCTLTELNLLRIHKSLLVSLPEALGNLTNLSNLVCSVNKLKSFPESVGRLSKLTLLDLSSNCLEELPNGIGTLEHLMTLNVSCNKLKTLPCLKGCKVLALLDASYNELSTFLDVRGSFELLADVILSNNKIEKLPALASTLSSLKKLELENNCITDVPGNLIECPKLKVVKLCGNALKDRRLRKLVENPRTTPEQVLKYIRAHCPKQPLEQEATDDDKENKQGESGDEAANEEDNVQFQRPRLLVSYPSDDLYVTVTKEALALRPHLVCCTVRGVSLEGDNFRKFIALQNKLHEGVCRRRLQSTIATHDITKIKTKLPNTESGQLREGLMYTARPKGGLIFVPLNRRSKPITAAQFLSSLKQEADNQRKQQKSNTQSGLYKYLQLVEGWTSFPCLLDTEETVLSVPPLTNADGSKISTATTDMLLEVTSDKNLAVCKQTMTELIQALLEVNPGTELTVQQVRVQGEDGGLRCVFPASNDLSGLTNVEVVRPHKEKS